MSSNPFFVTHISQSIAAMTSAEVEGVGVVVEEVVVEEVMEEVMEEVVAEVVEEVVEEEEEEEKEVLSVHRPSVVT